MRIQNQGFTLIELMIVVAIIAILASVAIPAYRENTQRSANGACLAEAKAYLQTAAADLAADRAANPFEPEACAGGLDEALEIEDYTDNAQVTFTTAARGASDVLQNVQCNVGSASCVLVDP